MTIFKTDIFFLVVLLNKRTAFDLKTARLIKITFAFIRYCENKNVYTLELKYRSLASVLESKSWRTNNNYNQLLQLCTARTAWSESDQAVRTVHSCHSWWLALLWSDSVIKLVAVLSVNVLSRGYEMLTNGNQTTMLRPMKSREISSFLALTNN